MNFNQPDWFSLLCMSSSSSTDTLKQHQTNYYFSQETQLA